LYFVMNMRNSARRGEASSHGNRQLTAIESPHHQTAMRQETPRRGTLLSSRCLRVRKHSQRENAEDNKTARLSPEILQGRAPSAGKQHCPDDQPPAIKLSSRRLFRSNGRAKTVVEY
jgi:hypothetical protein